VDEMRPIGSKRAWETAAT